MILMVVNLRPRMMFRVHALQSVKRDMRIDLRGRNVGVAEDGLHGPQVGAVLYHVRRARVPQHVRTGMASRSKTSLPNQLPNPLTAQASASSTQEQERRTTCLCNYFPAAFQVLL